MNAIGQVLPSLRGAADAIRAHRHAIGGYACTFDQVFRRGGVRTVVKPGAFACAIAVGDWDLLLSHSYAVAPAQASTHARTLHVEQDSYGLWFEASLPDDAAGVRLMDLVRQLKVCEVSVASHGFTIATVNGIDIWDEIEAWEISLMIPPARAACPGTFVLPNLAARRQRTRLRQRTR